MERTDDAELALEKMDKILREATCRGQGQIPAFMMHVAEVLDNTHPWHRELVNFSIFTGDKQAWMEAGNETIMEATASLSRPATSSTLALQERAARPALPAHFLTPAWREWAQRLFDEDSYGEMWGPPDAADLYPSVPW